MRKKEHLEKYEKQSVDVISTIVEYIIYGDKNDPLIFEYAN